MTSSSHDLPVVAFPTRLRLISPVHAGLSDELGGMLFKNGVTVGYVCRRRANNIAASFGDAFIADARTGTAIFPTHEGTKYDVAGPDFWRIGDDVPESLIVVVPEDAPSASSETAAVSEPASEGALLDPVRKAIDEGDHKRALLAAVLKAKGARYLRQAAADAGLTVSRSGDDLVALLAASLPLDKIASL